MSNELITILQNNPSIVNTGLDEDTAAVAGGMAGGSKRISIKGGVFRMMVNGKEQAVNEDRSMNVVFVKMAHHASRTWYPKAYKEGDKVSPACWSADSKTPDPAVKNPPAPSCETCPNSVKGSGPNGSGTACRLSWRTAVALPGQLDGNVYQLVLPATSAFGKEDNGRWPFRPYVQMLASHNVSAGAVVTKMQFDTKSPTPRLLFSPASVVAPEDMETVRAQGKSQAAENAIKLTVYQSDSVEGEEASEAPKEQATENDEPTKQAKKKAEDQPAEEVSDLVKKWAKK
jgi:hypothetical protein